MKQDETFLLIQFRSIVICILLLLKGYLIEKWQWLCDDPVFLQRFMVN
jgi:hypothetical protein